MKWMQLLTIYFIQPVRLDKKKDAPSTPEPNWSDPCSPRLSDAVYVSNSSPKRGMQHVTIVLDGAKFPHLYLHFHTQLRHARHVHWQVLGCKQTLRQLSASRCLYRCDSLEQLLKRWIQKLPLYQDILLTNALKTLAIHSNVSLV